MTALAAVALLLSLTGLTAACWPAPGTLPNFGRVTTSRRRRHRWTAALWTGLVAGVTLGACGGPTAAADPGLPPTPPAAECYEDEPCWDCTTMGNQLCGSPSAAPGFASGWVACGNQLIPADPRVDMQNPIGGLIYRRLLETMCPTQDGAQ